MISKYNKGTLIYDEWAIPQVRKSVIGKRKLYFWGGICALCVSVFIILIPYISNEKWYISLIGIFSALTSIFSILVSFCFDALRIYENGIVTPWKRTKLYTFFNEDYIPFLNIQMIYIGPKDSPEEFISIMIKDGKAIGFNKKCIFDNKLFEKLLCGKVEITNNKDNFIKLRNQIKGKS